MAAGPGRGDERRRLLELEKKRRQEIGTEGGGEGGHYGHGALSKSCRATTGGGGGEFEVEGG